MAGKRYSAGAIFLQVVPVFANVQRAIEDEAKNIDRALGGQMEKSGEKAGERAGKAASKAMQKEVDEGARKLSGSFEREFHKSIDEINKALGGINTNRLSNDMRKEIAAIKREIASVKDLDLTVDVDKRKADEALAVLEGRLRGFRDATKIVFRADIDNALKGFAKIEAAKDKIEDPVEIEVSADFKVAERQMSAFEKSFKKTTDKAAGHLKGSLNKEVRNLGDSLSALKDLRIGVDISSGMARRELLELMSDLDDLQRDNPDIDIKVETAAALAELRAFEVDLQRLEEDDIDIDVNVDTKKAQRNADAAANSFRSFNIILLAVTGAGPALIPVLAAIAGGLLALGPAAATASFGLGAVLVGFSGLGDALSALQAQQDQAATNAQSNANQQRDAAYAIRDAEEALSDARRNAARAAEDAAERVADARERSADMIEDALERQKDAQEEYRDAVKEVQEAEQDLRDAREEARKDAETIAKRQRQNAVDERQAVLDLFDAQTQYNAVMADTGSTATDKERASVDLEQAQIALNNVRDEQVALAEEAADYAKNGVDGSEKVQSAQDDLTAAIEAQKDALEEVKEAAKEVDEARQDGAKLVADAIEDQNEVLSDNRRAIEDAAEALRRARESATTDLAAIDSQAQAVNAAFDKLGPAGRRFALFLFSLREGFYQFRDAVQQAMLPAIQEAIEGFIGSANSSKAAGAIIALAGAFGQFTKALSQSFQGPAWAAFFDMLAVYGPLLTEAYGEAFILFLEAMANIMVIVAPFALEFAEGLANMMGVFAEWAGSKEGAEDIQKFLGYVREVAPAVLDFFALFIDAVIKIMVALAPYGEVVLGIIDGILEFITEMPAAVLGALTAGLTVLLFASQVAYAVMNVMNAGKALFATTLGPWVFIIVAVGLALAWLWKTNEDFRAFITDAWERISEAFTKAYHEHIKPALDELWEALKMLWDEVLQPFFEWLGPILVELFEVLIPLLAQAFSIAIKAIARWIKNILIPTIHDMADIFTWLWKNVLKPTWNAIETAAKWLWKNVLVPAFEDIGETWDDLVRGMKWVWNNIIQPIWDFIEDTALPALETAFKTTLGIIGDMWEEMKKTVGTPIKFVLDTIINEGLIDGFNKVAGWVGAPKLDHIPIPESLQKYATGGVMPGYTPGRDPHVFTSPTAGTLMLSGGEAVLRPEFTRAVGEDWVNQVNAAAMGGGVGAVRQILGLEQRFAKGGVFFPVPGGYVNRTPYNLGHDGMDINHPNDASGNVPFYSATSGRVTTTGYSRGYGNAVFVASPYGELVYGHAYDGSIRVSPGQTVSAGTWLANIGNTGNSTGAHLHFGFPGGTFYGAEALLSGAGTIKAEDMGGAEKQRRSIPGWLMDVVKNPLNAVKNWMMAPIADATESMRNSEIFKTVSKVPRMLGEKVTDKVWDVVPGWVKSAAGWAGGAADWVVGGVSKAADKVGDIAGDVAGGISKGAGAVGDALGLATGGILPYNGTMMYDSGGYLPPGLTSVVNLTGKPEPVFTADQFDGMRVGGGDGFTYAPTFQGSNLTAADVVDDLDFTRRKIQREGRYGRSKT